MIEQRGKVYRRIVLAGCACALAVVLVAGLWPFHVPKNDVVWLQEGEGVELGRHATLLSSEAFPVAPKAGTSLELWVRNSDSWDESTILAFDSSRDPSFPFSLQQVGRILIVQRYETNPEGKLKRLRFSTPGMFRLGTISFVTITSGNHGTRVYLNGVLQKASQEFRIKPGDLSGRLIVANSTTDDSWSGQWKGLAIYHSELTAESVAAHYQAWMASNPASTEAPPIALYRFNEASGSVVYDQSGLGRDLKIPEGYMVLHPAWMMPAWRQYQFGWPNWSYWKDVLNNVAGFVPVGFFLLAYWSTARPVRRPVACVILAGFVLTFAIESTQRFLPTRDSDMTDVITNTLGTVLGVLLYRWTVVQSLWNAITRYICGVFQERAEAAQPAAQPVEQATLSA
jgi:VanZ family protein